MTTRVRHAIVCGIHACDVYFQSPARPPSLSRLRPVITRIIMLHQETAPGGKQHDKQ